MIAAPQVREFDEDVRRLVAALPEPQPTNGYDQILVADDGSQGAQAALERAASIASPDSTVTVITVIPFEAVGASPDPIKPELRDWQWKALTEATAVLEQRGVHPFIEAAAGNPAPVILEVARTLQATLSYSDVATIGRWHASITKRSIRRALVQQLECDALVVAAH